MIESYPNRPFFLTRWGLFYWSTRYGKYLFFSIYIKWSFFFQLISFFYYPLNTWQREHSKVFTIGALEILHICLIPLQAMITYWKKWGWIGQLFYYHVHSMDDHLVVWILPSKASHHLLKGMNWLRHIHLYCPKRKFCIFHWFFASSFDTWEILIHQTWHGHKDLTKLVSIGELQAQIKSEEES